jgi:mannose-6-phosphate isomerase-like protein (cupin superfamily)
LVASFACLNNPDALVFAPVAGVAKWQTRRTQNPVVAIPCGFKSLLRHPMMKTYLSGKVIVEELPLGGADAGERRLVSAKGEMAQILNRAEESFRHLVYWDLESPKSRQVRGNHYHLRKTERYYVISGELELILKDIASLQAEKVVIARGNRIVVAPNVAHAFRSLSYAQVLEFSPGPYDPGDTRPYDLMETTA